MFGMLVLATFIEVSSSQPDKEAVCGEFLWFEFYKSIILTGIVFISDVGEGEEYDYL